MKQIETYWTYQPNRPIPEVADLPPGTFDGTDDDFSKLSPGMRREIYRSAMKRMNK